jgi:undecaprenyl pyrophosphate phosphatase UppP
MRGIGLQLPASRLGNHKGNRLWNIFVFLFCAGVFVALFASASLKLTAVIQRDKMFDGKDPVFSMIDRRYTMAVASLAEITVCYVICYVRSRLHKLYVVLWLGTVFAIYRVGMHLQPGSLRSHSTCACMGNVRIMFGLSDEAANRISFYVLLYILFGAVVLLLWNFVNRFYASTGPDQWGPVKRSSCELV